VDARVTGADQLARLSKQLKEAGDKGLQRELSKGIRDALKPVRTVDLPKSALETLPRKGGINVIVAKTKYTINKRTGNRIAGLRLTAKNIVNLRRIDDGVLRHPVFQNPHQKKKSAKTAWVNQKVTPGWFTEPTGAAAPDIQREVTKAMDRVAGQITKGL